MNVKFATYYNNAKAAYSFVFDDGCYGESNQWMYEIQKEIFEKTGVKIKITSAQTVGFISPNAKNFWQKLYDEGYCDFSAHSVNHCIGYNKDADPEALDYDARVSKEKIEQMYGTKIISFVTPGGGDDIEGIQVLKKYYYANRNGHDRFNDTYNMNLYDIGTFTANFGYGEQVYIDNIDKTVEKGAWTVKMNHWLTKKEQDTHHSQKHETFLPECAYLAEQQKKNNLWVCSMNDMIKYIYVRDNSKAVIEDGMLWLESDLDKEIFDAPVTVIVDDKCYNVCLGEKISI